MSRFVFGLSISGKVKTRIFISCGQARGTGEIQIARDIAKRLSPDFDCYVALNEQTLLGLRENIFDQLRQSEYFLFIDFRREFLPPRKSRWPKLASFFSAAPRYRGSLFSHQELSIASFLEMNCIAFHEVGVDEGDGMRGAMQLNSTLFSDRKELAAMAEAAVRGRWVAGWKNLIEIESAVTAPTDAHQGDLNGPLIRHFHLAVRNRHKWKTAEECRVFPIKFEQVGVSAPILYEPVEVKWAGSIVPSIPILPEQARRFDAFQVPHLTPSRLVFKGFSDSTEFRPQVSQVGVYRLTYLATSRNLGSCQKTIEITALGDLATIAMMPLA